MNAKTRTTESQHQRLEREVARLRADYAIEALSGVLDYCKKLEDQGIQAIVTRDLRKIISDVIPTQGGDTNVPG